MVAKFAVCFSSRFLQKIFLAYASSNVAIRHLLADNLKLRAQLERGGGRSIESILDDFLRGNLCQPASSAFVRCAA